MSLFELNRVAPLSLIQGSPAPGPRTSTCPWPVRNRAAQQEVRWGAGEWAKLHLYLQPLPITHITAWTPPPVRSATALDSHRSMNPTVNCMCEGSRLCTPYESLMPYDLRWSWGGDASSGERLQIEIIISREVWLHRDHNKSIACRLIWSFCVSICTDRVAAMTGQLSGFTTQVKEATAECESTPCVINREMLASWKMSPELNNVLQDVIKIINHIKVHALNSRLFVQLCEVMDTEHTSSLIHRSEMAF